MWLRNVEVTDLLPYWDYSFALLTGLTLISVRMKDFLPFHYW